MGAVGALVRGGLVGWEVWCEVRRGGGLRSLVVCLWEVVIDVEVGNGWIAFVFGFWH